MASHHPDHPCGSVPTHQWSVTVWYCAAHQAYYASAGNLIDMGREVVTRGKFATVEFGPFDTPTDVQHWVQSQLPGIRKLAKS